VAPPPAIGCAQDPSTQARKPQKIAASNRPRLILGNKFKRFYPFAHLTDVCGPDKHITPFSSTIFGMTVFYCQPSLKTTLLVTWQSRWMN
jgi:hypothetical protein